MHSLNFEETLEKILQQDRRYHRDAYHFVREGLDYTQKMVGKVAGKGEIRHLRGQELLAGLRAFALEQFGPMSLMVLNEWGVRQGEDFGEIVFNLVESSLLAKTKEDSREDFRGGYDFFEAFRRPFLPTRSAAAREPDSKSAQV